MKYSINFLGLKDRESQTLCLGTIVFVDMIIACEDFHFKKSAGVCTEEDCFGCLMRFTSGALEHFSECFQIPLNYAKSLFKDFLKKFNKSELVKIGETMFSRLVKEEDTAIEEDVDFILNKLFKNGELV
jgi:hypothetical protein